MRTINETYHQRINNCIVEAYGISEKLHLEIIPRFVSMLKGSIKMADVDNWNGIETKHGRFKFDFSGDGKYVLGATWTVYYFKDLLEYENFHSMHPMDAGVSYRNKIFLINIFYVDGKPMMRNFYDSIGHELEHLFQEVRIGKEFGNTNIYNLAKGNISSNDCCKRYLAWIIYASCKSEQEAMINGFYQTFMNGEVGPWIDKEIEESECGQWLKRLYKAYQFLKKNKENDDLIKSIGEYKRLNDRYSYKYFLYIARNGIASFEKRIARLTIGLKKTLFNEHTLPLSGKISLLEYYKIEK